MSDPFVAEVRIFAGNFAPRGWALCDGQLLPISQNTALFSLLGTVYGGDGRSIFALPNLQGRAPMFYGQGPGLSLYSIGEESGSETITLLEAEIPNHTHSVNSVVNQASATDPTGLYMGTTTENTYTTTATNAQMSPNAIATAGGNLPHNNMQPYLVLTFLIALQGVFPPRS